MDSNPNDCFSLRDSKAELEIDNAAMEHAVGINQLILGVNRVEGATN